MKPACDPPTAEPPENAPDLMRDQSDTQNCPRKHKVCTHWPLLNIHFVHLLLICFLGFFFYLSVLSFVPPAAQHAEGGAEDVCGDTDGTADVLGGHRPSGLVQPCVVLLGQNLIFSSLKLVHLLVDSDRKISNDNIVL